MWPKTSSGKEEEEEEGDEIKGGAKDERKRDDRFNTIREKDEGEGAIQQIHYCCNPDATELPFFSRKSFFCRRTFELCDHAPITLTYYFAILFCLGVAETKKMAITLGEFSALCQHLPFVLIW
jgi:hypothetical protein